MTDPLGPFVEGETAGAAAVCWDSGNQIGRGNAVANGVNNVCADAKDAVIVHEHRVVVP